MLAIPVQEQAAVAVVLVEQPLEFIPLHKLVPLLVMP
jgi:hypothetical protein